MKLSKKIEKAFKDACKKTGRPESIDLSSMPEDMRDQAMAQYMLMVITEAKNDGWKADWTNSNQRKWFPYFWYSYADAGRAARLCLKDESTSDAAGTELTELYEIALNG